MTCSERLRKNIQTGEYYNRLDKYFKALESNNLECYHDEREKNQKKRWEIKKKKRDKGFEKL